ncbi:hypothetical protein BCR43DRAFT_421663, partial [Syncephalastrum racemosum]
KLKAWAPRKFQPRPSLAGYVMVYLPTSSRTSHSEARKALWAMGVAQERVIDVHFPARGTVGLLIHASFEQELRSKLEKSKVTPVSFNPRDANTIGDPQHRDKSAVERAAMAQDLYDARMLQACLRM